MTLLQQVTAMEEVFWINPEYNPGPDFNAMSLGFKDIRDAEDRLKRFAPYIAEVFPETRPAKGIIESPLVPIPEMKSFLEERYGSRIPGELWMKCDSHLPISGSIKARGGIYEVLKHAEDLTIESGMLSPGSDYSVLAGQKFRRLFSRYTIVVGSTGNLGLSIGIIGATLGFNVTVHMSAGAREWKKELLRSYGVKVMEHNTDYSKAVEEGRQQAASDPECYFIDDENSPHLFLGYAVAALRLQRQLEERRIAVDEEHPLFVYLPCGVGGGPGGITFGLKQVFGRHVHCFFAEPTHAPCMLLGMMTGKHNLVSVQDFGIDNITEADGLAVGRPSAFVGRLMEPLLSGCFTVSDKELFVLLRALADLERTFLEPSALAGMPGAARLTKSQTGRHYLQKNFLADKMVNSTQIVWATGGSMVPRGEMETYYAKGI